MNDPRRISSDKGIGGKVLGDCRTRSHNRVFAYATTAGIAMFCAPAIALRESSLGSTTEPGIRRGRFAIRFLSLPSTCPRGTRRPRGLAHDSPLRRRRPLLTGANCSPSGAHWTCIALLSPNSIQSDMWQVCAPALLGHTARELKIQVMESKGTLVGAQGIEPWTSPV
jgi:hypothetical protein